MALRPPLPLRVRPWFAAGDAARRRSVAPSAHVRRPRLGTGYPPLALVEPAGAVQPAGRPVGPVAPSPAAPVGAWPAAACHVSRQRLTPHQGQFIATVHDVDVSVALANLRAARTSEATEAANSAAYPPYLLVGEKVGGIVGQLTPGGTAVGCLQPLPTTRFLHPSQML